MQYVTVSRISALLESATNGQALRSSPLFFQSLGVIISRKGIEDAGWLADFMIHTIDAAYHEKLRVLCKLEIKKRIELVVELLSEAVGEKKENFQITKLTQKNLPLDNDLDIPSIIRPDKSSLLRRPMIGIGNWTGQSLPPMLSGFGSGGFGNSEEADEIAELKKKLDVAKLPPEAQKVADRELKRLRKMTPAQVEYGVCRTYLETLAEIPWNSGTEDHLGEDSLRRARKQLDDDHYGLEKIKKRLLEYLAVLRLKQTINANIEAKTRKALIKQPQAEETETQSEAAEPHVDNSKVQLLKKQRMVDKSPILLLAGPPGTGKTSLARSVAMALGRKFHRISLGGVRDEAEIRGHRRTYVAAMPGLIVSGLKKVGVNNPVFLLDEIDKVSGSNFHGDPSAAMLEVLDPEQNYTFTDHYLNIPFDLSKVLFIATANSLDTISPPLLDRMEMIPLSGYTTVEKRHIATNHLIPKQITTNGLNSEQIFLPEAVVDTIITAYTRESGVRNLEREIGAVCRFKAVELADSQDASVSSVSTRYNPFVSPADLDTILGIPRFEEELAEKESIPGIVTGLVAYSTGGQGSILFIEVADMPGAGRVQLTGKLGDVLKESVEVALSWVKAHAYELGLLPSPGEDIMQRRSIHVHCPSGAVPKDGPSAGLAHILALVSLFSSSPVPPTTAMTGEVSLRGKVLPVGGIKEKLIGALRAGVKTVMLPVGNAKDTRDLPEEVKAGVHIICVANVWEALRCVWPESRWGPAGREHVESRL